MPRVKLLQGQMCHVCKGFHSGYLTRALKGNTVVHCVHPWWQMGPHQPDQELGFWQTTVSFTVILQTMRWQSWRIVNKPRETGTKPKIHRTGRQYQLGHVGCNVHDLLSPTQECCSWNYVGLCHPSWPWWGCPWQSCTPRLGNLPSRAIASGCLTSSSYLPSKDLARHLLNPSIGSAMVVLRTRPLSPRLREDLLSTRTKAKANTMVTGTRITAKEEFSLDQ